MSEDTNKASQSEEEQIQEEDTSSIYAEMDRAAEEVADVAEEKTEEKVEEKEEEKPGKEVKEPENVSRETIDEPEDNAERSKLGRRVKGMEDTLQQILARLETKPEETKKEPEIEIDLDEDFLIPTTRKEFIEQVASIIENPEIATKVVRLNKQDKEAELQKQIDYEKRYVNSVAEFRDDPYYEEVSQILLDSEDKNNPFNRQHNINTPDIDAEKNFLAAKAHILESKLKGTDKKINLRQDTREPSKPDIETKNTEATKKEIQLDEHAAGFLKNLKGRGENTEELVKRAFA